LHNAQENRPKEKHKNKSENKVALRRNVEVFGRKGNRGDLTNSNGDAWVRSVRKSVNRLATKQSPALSRVAEKV
jgi:hypothetical protein